MVEVQLPAFAPDTAIAAPSHTETVVLTMVAASCSLLGGVALGSHKVIIQMPYNNVVRNAEAIQFPVPAPAGALVVVAASLTYNLSNGKDVVSKAFMPASVIGAMYC